MKYILITGNLIEGYKFEGPFDNEKNTIELARSELGAGEEWQVIKLVKPNYPLEGNFGIVND